LQTQVLALNRVRRPYPVAKRPPFDRRIELPSWLLIGKCLISTALATLGLIESLLMLSTITATSWIFDRDRLVQSKRLGKRRGRRGHVAAVSGVAIAAPPSSIRRSSGDQWWRVSGIKGKRILGAG
jgi:hypothetical protein